MDERRVTARGGLVMEDDVMTLGITLFVCLIVPTDKPSAQTLIHKISAITVCTLDGCLTANTAKPAGLSRKWRWHKGLLSTPALFPVFWQWCHLPLFYRDKKTKQSKWINQVMMPKREMREIWDDNCHICPSDCQKNCHTHTWSRYAYKNTVEAGETCNKRQYSTDMDVYIAVRSFSNTPKSIIFMNNDGRTKNSWLID